MLRWSATGDMSAAENAAHLTELCDHCGKMCPCAPSSRNLCPNAVAAAATERAYLSPCRLYRYSLTRDVAPLTGEGTVSFIGLNPSTADETVDDPTIRRCMRFARDWGFARLKMLNLYAYRATDPNDLFAFGGDMSGPDNDCTIAKVVGGSDLVICAWGVNGPPGRVADVLRLVAAPHCLGVTMLGAPRHPLYVKAATLPQPYGDLHPVARWQPRAESSSSALIRTRWSEDA